LAAGAKCCAAPRALSGRARLPSPGLTAAPAPLPARPRPQALIWSAVAASSAFPGLFQPQDILARNARGEEVPFNCAAGGATGPATAEGAASAAAAAAAAGARRWRDGSLELDLPTFLLAEM
jgi:TAG lipase/steryl ester hydrolase/phospholipase A2/LPA acyltransferase